MYGVYSRVRKIVKVSFWIFFIASVVVLMSITQKKELDLPINYPLIQISSVDENTFLTQQEVLAYLEKQNLIFIGQKIGELQAEQIESVLSQLEEVRSVAVYQHLNGSWHIDLELRCPIARIFNVNNHSFFIDSEGYTISSTNKHLARVVVVTGAITHRYDKQQKLDTLAEHISTNTLKDMYRLTSFLYHDTFLRTLIGQVYVDKDDNFTLIPIVGDQKIAFGKAKDDQQVKDKFEKLKIFYHEALPYEGWNKYNKISVEYDKQIVCDKKE